MKFTAGHSAFEASDLIPVEDQKDVFAHFGLAMHVANVLEHGVVNGVFVATLLPRMREFGNAETWGQAIDDLFEKMFTLTFGNMIRELEKTGAYSKSLIELLLAANISRNYLIHHFQRDSADLMLTVKGRMSMIETYEGYVSEFSAADDALEKEIGPIRSRHGVTDEWLNDAYEKGLQRVLEVDDAAG